MDTENLLVVGDSAGGQLASHYLTILTNPEFAKLFIFQTPDVKVRAVALNCGVYDTKNCVDTGVDEYLLEYVDKEKLTKDMWESLDTIKYMTSDFPPAFVMSAYHDFLVANAEPMYRHLQSLSIPCELRIYGSKEQEEIAHVFHVNIRLPEAGKCNDEECEFFRRFVGCKPMTKNV